MRCVNGTLSFHSSVHSCTLLGVAFWLGVVCQPHPYSIQAISQLNSDSPDLLNARVYFGTSLCAKSFYINPQATRRRYGHDLPAVREVGVPLRQFIQPDQ